MQQKSVTLKIFNKMDIIIIIMDKILTAGNPLAVVLDSSVNRGSIGIKVVITEAMSSRNIKIH